MTVVVYANPDAGAYGSQRYTATINGSNADVFAYKRTAEFTTPNFWTIGEAVEVSFLTFATDTSVDGTVTLLSGPITSVTVFPHALASKVSVVGGILHLTGLVALDYMRIEVNGNDAGRARPIFIRACTIVPDPTPGPNVIVYNGTQVLAQSGKTLWFQAGSIYNLTTDAWGGILFPVEDGATVHISGGAWVIGNFDTRGSDNVTIKGHGVLSGEFITNEAVQVLPTFLERFVYSMIFGHISGVFPTGCVVEGITIVVAPYYLIADACSVVRDTMLLTPWTDNSNAISPLGDPNDGHNYTIERNVIWSGDDTIVLDPWRGNGIVRNNLLSTSGSAIFLHSYHIDFDLGIYSVTLTDNVIRPVCEHYLEIDGREGGAVVQAWTDEYVGSAATKYGNVTYRGLKIENDSAGMMSVIWNMGNKRDPFTGGRDRRGSLSGFTFEDVTCDVVPTDKSRFYGYDWQNTPHNFHFSNVRIGGTLLTTTNWFDFFASGETGAEYLFHIFVGEKLMVTKEDICNTALSFVGERDRVTSIDPPDGSEEARHCARAYVEAFEELIELHPWNFTLRKIQLTVVNADAADTDDPAWAYRYEIPDGMHEALSILWDGASSDTVVGGVKTPQDFHIKVSTDDEVLRIYTNVPDAWLRYSVYITDPNLCSRVFLAALEQLTAAKLAGTVVRGDTGETMKNRCLAMFGKYLAEAKIKDSKQRQIDTETSPEWMRGRERMRHPFRVN